LIGGGDPDDRGDGEKIGADKRPRQPGPPHGDC
jgi:hypothetical protein